MTKPLQQGAGRSAPLANAVARDLKPRGRMSATRDNTNGNRRSRRAHLIDATLMDSLGLDALIPPNSATGRRCSSRPWPTSWIVCQRPAQRDHRRATGIRTPGGSGPASRGAACAVSYASQARQVMARNHALDAGLQAVCKRSNRCLPAFPLRRSRRPSAERLRRMSAWR